MGRKKKINMEANLNTKETVEDNNDKSQEALNVVETKADENTSSFTNPFQEGVNYRHFLDAIPKGMTVQEYCEGNLEQEQIEWLVNDLSHYENSLKLKEQENNNN